MQGGQIGALLAHIIHLKVVEVTRLVSSPHKGTVDHFTANFSLKTVEFQRVCSAAWESEYLLENRHIKVHAFLLVAY
jgi:hypothetical protein